MFASSVQFLKYSAKVILFAAFVAGGASEVMGQAQSNAADLRGYVRDQQGAVVTNATVTARNAATNTLRSATTNGEGFYEFVNLPPGDYDLTVEAQSFKKALLPAVKLTIGQRADLDVTLEAVCSDHVDRRPRQWQADWPGAHHGIELRRSAWPFKSGPGRWRGQH